MKTFDIFADERLIKGDLFVVDLPLKHSQKTTAFNITVGNRSVRTDIIVDKILSGEIGRAQTFDLILNGRTIRCDVFVSDMTINDNMSAFCNIIIDSKISDIIASKTALIDDAAEIVVYAEVNSAAVKFVDLDSKVEMDAQTNIAAEKIFDAEPVGVMLKSIVRDTLQKVIDTYSAVEIGVHDTVNILPQKSLGKPRFDISLDSLANVFKTAYIKTDNGIGVEALLESPNIVYYVMHNESVVLCADVRSLSFLLNIKETNAEVLTTADVYDIDLLGSFGRCEFDVALHTDVDFLETQVVDAESSVNFIVSADPNIEKTLIVDNGCGIECSADVSMRIARTLQEVDEFGTLANIDSMVLDDLYYVDIE